MEGPTVQLRLPDGRTVVAGPDAIFGRSSAATVRIDDPRVSTVHAELSWRADGFVLLARGGRLRVGGRAVREVVLASGLEIELAPAVVLGVGAVREGAADVVPPTVGRDRLRVVLAEAGVDIFRGRSAEPVVTLTGVSARILASVAPEPGQVTRWDQVAEAVWPEEGALRAATREGASAGDRWTAIDERRLRNRWDQALRVLRKSLEPLGREGLLEVAGGTLTLRLEPGDVVE